MRLSTETVKGSALPLESVDDVEGGDGLPLGVLSVGDRVSDDVLEDWMLVLISLQCWAEEWKVWRWIVDLQIFRTPRVSS